MGVLLLCCCNGRRRRTKIVFFFHVVICKYVRSKSSTVFRRKSCSKRLAFVYGAVQQYTASQWERACLVARGG